MRPLALLPLFARPAALAVAATGAVIVIVLLDLITTLSPPHLDPARMAAGAVGLAAVWSALLGFFCGGAISQAARCSFAWTTPRYRRRLRLEFTAAGSAVAVVIGLLTTIILSPGPNVLPMIVAAAVAAFAAGAALSTVPEGVLLFPLLLIAIVARRAISTAWVVQSPGMFTLAAIAVAAASIGAAFSERSFRWASLVGGPNPLFSGGKPWLDILRSLPWWPARATAAPQGRIGPDTRPDYGTATTRRVAQLFRAQSPRALAVMFSVGVVQAAIYAAVLHLAGGATHDSSLERFCVIWLAMAFVQPRQFDRSGLPWSRRDHLVITWGWHLALLLVYALVAWPSFMLLTRDSAPLGMSFFAGTVLVASVAVFMPAASWALGDLLGSSRPFTAKRFLIGVPTLMWGPIALDALLRWLLPTTTAQFASVGLLLVASQALHWYMLKRYFERRDLVGASG